MPLGPIAFLKNFKTDVRSRFSEGFGLIGAHEKVQYLQPVNATSAEK
jgi:hypothetical protein